MKAIVYDRYGGPEVLRLANLPIPEIKPSQVLLKVHASSLNSADYRLMRATPFLARLHTGLLRPKKIRVLGADVAGTIEQISSDVERFKVGDEVFAEAFADGMGAFAEYVCVSEKALVPKPDNLSFNEAATVPLAGVTALQGVRDAGEVEPGDEVLIHGAGGGVGSFVVQVAKAFDARVTAVCGPGSVEMVRGFGADRVIDYEETDFTKEEMRYDVILAVNGYHTLREYKRCLKPGGRYVVVGGDNRQLFEALFLRSLAFLGAGKSSRILSIDDSKRVADLAELANMLAAGRLRTTIDRTYELEELAEAMRYMERGHVRGKVVIEIAKGE